MQYLQKLLSDTKAAMKLQPIETLDNVIDLNSLNPNQQCVYVYYLEKGNIDDVVTAFSRFKETKMYRMPQLNESLSNVLYVGSSHKPRIRLKQHDGITENRSTYALHLKKWLPESFKTKLKVQLMNTSPEILELYEHNLANKLSPVFGKHKR